MPWPFRMQSGRHLVLSESISLLALAKKLSKCSFITTPRSTIQCKKLRRKKRRNRQPYSPLFESENLATTREATKLNCLKLQSSSAVRRAFRIGAGADGYRLD